MLIFLLVLIFFGGEKLPEFARGLGKVMREFKKASSGIEAEIKKAMDEHPAPPPYVPPKSANLLGPVLPPPPALVDSTPGRRIMEHPLPVEPDTHGRTPCSRAPAWGRWRSALLTPRRRWRPLPTPPVAPTEPGPVA